MTERSSLTQMLQWGVEASSATSGAANINMSALGYEPSPKTEGGSFRPPGSKFKTLAWIGKEWSEGSLSGQATYNELIFPLASVLSAPTTSHPTTGSTMYVFSSSPSGADAPKQFTIQMGENGNFTQSSGVLINELGLSFTRSEVSISGSAYGRAMSQQSGSMSTVTLSPTAIMILPAEVTVQWDTTYSTINLATTAVPTTAAGKLLRVLSCDVSVGNRYSPVWVLDAAQSSYAASVETEPSLTGKLVMEADTAGMARLAEMQASTTGFLRVRAQSSQNADTNVKYTFLLDMACKVSDTGGYSDQDGVYAIEWSLLGIYDSTFGGAVRAKVINNVDPSALVGGSDTLTAGTYGTGLHT